MRPGGSFTFWQSGASPVVTRTTPTLPVGFDGAHLTLLTPEDATHDVSLAPSGRYFVDSYSPTSPR